jgi:hypothetical protein
MKIYIDHFPQQNDFVTSLSSRISKQNKDVEVTIYLEHRGNENDIG